MLCVLRNTSHTLNMQQHSTNGMIANRLFEVNVGRGSVCAYVSVCVSHVCGCPPTPRPTRSNGTFWVPSGASWSSTTHIFICCVRLIQTLTRTTTGVAILHACHRVGTTHHAAWCVYVYTITCVFIVNTGTCTVLRLQNPGKARHRARRRRHKRRRCHINVQCVTIHIWHSKCPGNVCSMLPADAPASHTQLLFLY